MANHRVAGGCCGNFPEPEVGKEKKEKACCNSGDCGCGFGPVKEGSVKDASGSDLLQSKRIIINAKNYHDKAEYLLVTRDGDYLIDVRHINQDKIQIQILLEFATGQPGAAECEKILVFGLKRNDFSYRHHEIRLDTIIRIIPWDLEKWKAETSDGIV